MSSPRAILISILFIIIVTVGGTVLVSKKHKKDVAKTEVKDDFLKVSNYPTEAPTSAPINAPNAVITTTTTTYGNNYSYWWILVEDKGGAYKRNGFFKQEHPYFSYDEAIKAFKKDSGKDCFILNIVKVDEETYNHNTQE